MLLVLVESLWKEVLMIYDVHTYAGRVKVKVQICLFGVHQFWAIFALFSRWLDFGDVRSFVDNLYWWSALFHCNVAMIMLGPFTVFIDKMGCHVLVIFVYLNFCWPKSYFFVKYCYIKYHLLSHKMSSQKSPIYVKYEINKIRCVDSNNLRTHYIVDLYYIGLYVMLM